MTETFGLKGKKRLDLYEARGRQEHQKMQQSGLGKDEGGKRAFGYGDWE
jgi:hypothetical protein